SVRSIECELFQSFRPKKIKLPYKQIGYAGAGGGEEDLLITKKDQISKRVKKGENVKVIDMSNRVIEDQPRGSGAYAAVHCQKDREGQCGTLARAYFGNV